MSDAVEVLTPKELKALCGLLRLVVLADRSVGGAELDALEAVGDRVAEGSAGAGAPYREAPPAPMGGAAFRGLFGEANREMPTEDDVRVAAERVTRREAQEAIYGLLFEVASADGLHPSEEAILAWVERTWSLEVRPAGEA